MEQKTIKLLKKIIDESGNFSDAEKVDLTNAVKTISSFNTDLNQNKEYIRLINLGKQFIKHKDDTSRVDQYLIDYGLPKDASIDAIIKRKKSILNNLANLYNNTKYIDKGHRYLTEYNLISDRFDKIIESRENNEKFYTLSNAKNQYELDYAADDLRKALRRYVDYLYALNKYSIDTNAKNETNDVLSDTFTYAYDDMDKDEIDDSKANNNNMPTSSVEIKKDYLEPIEYYPGSRIRKPRLRGDFETDEKYNAFLSEYFSRYNQDIPDELNVDEENNFYYDKLEYIIDEIHNYFTNIKYAFCDLRWLYNHAIAQNNKIKNDLSSLTQDDVEDKESFNKVISELKAKQKALRQFIDEYEDKLDVLNSINREIYGEADLKGDTSVTIKLDELKNDFNISVLLTDDENRDQYVTDDFTIDKSSLIEVEINKVINEYLADIINDSELDIDLDTINNANVELIVGGKSYIIPFEYLSQTIIKIIKEGIDNYNSREVESYKKTLKTRKRKTKKKTEEKVVEEQPIITQDVQNNSIEEQLDKSLNEVQESYTPVKENEELLENEKLEDAFQRVMGFDYDLNKYDVKTDDGAHDAYSEGLIEDGPINTFSIYEKNAEQPNIEDKVEEKPVDNSIATAEDVFNSIDQIIGDQSEQTNTEADEEVTDEQILDEINNEVINPLEDKYDQYLEAIGLGAEKDIFKNGEEVVEMPSLAENSNEQSTTEVDTKDINVESTPVETIDDDEITDATDEEIASFEELWNKYYSEQNEIETPENEEVSEPIEEAKENTTEQEVTELPPIEAVDEVFTKTTEETKETETEETKTEETTSENKEEVKEESKTEETPTSDDKQETKEQTENKKVEEKQEESTVKGLYKVKATRKPKNLGKSIAFAALCGISFLFTPLINGVVGLSAAAGVINVNIDNIFVGISKHKLKKIAKRNNAKFYFLSNDKIEARSLDGTELTEKQKEDLQTEIDEKINKKLADTNIPKVTLSSLENAFIEEDEIDNYYFSSKADDEEYKELIVEVPTHTVDDIIEEEKQEKTVAPENKTFSINKLIDEIYTLNPQLNGKIKRDLSDGVYYVEVADPENIKLPEGYMYYPNVGIKAINDNEDGEPNFVIEIIKEIPINNNKLAEHVEEALVQDIIDKYGDLLLAEDAYDVLISFGDYTEDEIKAAINIKKEEMNKANGKTL